MKGACASRARRREISVLPTPVGPIIKMFLGVTSRRSSGGSCWRRQRLRRATATARLASFWPTILRSSSETISRGEKLVSDIAVTFQSALLLDRVAIQEAHHHVFVDKSTVHEEISRLGAIDAETEPFVELD